MLIVSDIERWCKAKFINPRMDCQPSKLEHLNKSRLLAEAGKGKATR
jgi:hypothetical protein